MGVKGIVKSREWLQKIAAANTRPLEVRFWAKVRKSDGCWTWTGRPNESGYGSIRPNPTEMGHPLPKVLAHRLSWQLHFGTIPDGLEVCHTCDNPPCVNPGHLFLGTHADNIEDMRRKGRARSANGSAHTSAKLTDEAVREIRRTNRPGGNTRELARRFGVTSKTIRRIAVGDGWAGVA